MRSTIKLTQLQVQRALFQLGETELFAALAAPALLQVVERIQLINLHESDALFEQKATAKHIYLLSTGLIKLVRTASHGGEKIIATIRPGSTFAEAVIFSERKTYPVSAIAVTDSSVWKIDGEHFISVLEQHPKACIAALKRLTNRLYDQLAEIEKITLHTATARLIDYLLMQVPNDYINQEGCSNQGTPIKLDMPKKELASQLSIVPATFSRSLNKLMHEGLIDVNDDTIVLLNIKRLKHYSIEIFV